MKLKYKITLAFISAAFLLGYKTFPNGNTWSITSADPKIFLKFCQNITPSTNNVGSSDPLYGTTLTHASIVTSILNDYNNIGSTFVRLADSATDGAFNATTHANRIITICNGSAGSFDGYAQQTVTNGKVTGCTITMSSLSMETKRLLRTLEHEIGHCLGLDHPQESRWALMSYFSDYDGVYRLHDDDKAGLTYLYPTDTGYSRSANFGASCKAND